MSCRLVPPSGYEPNHSPTKPVRPTGCRLSYCYEHSRQRVSISHSVEFPGSHSMSLSSSKCCQHHFPIFSPRLTTDHALRRRLSTIACEVRFILYWQFGKGVPLVGLLPWAKTGAKGCFTNLQSCCEIQSRERYNLITMCCDQGISFSRLIRIMRAFCSFLYHYL